MGKAHWTRENMVADRPVIRMSWYSVCDRRQDTGLGL